MRFSVLIIRLFGTNDGAKSQFYIHVFMDGQRAVVITPAGQIDGHAPIPIHAVVLMVDFLNLCFDFLFVGIVICLPVFPVVVVCVWIYVQPPQEPAQAKQLMILFKKPISL